MEIMIDEFDSIPKEKYEELLGKYSHLIQQEIYKIIPESKIMFGSKIIEKQELVDCALNAYYSMFSNKFIRLNKKSKNRIEWIMNGCKIYKQTKRIIK